MISASSPATEKVPAQANHQQISRKSQCTREEICDEIEEQDTPDPDEFCRKESLEKGREKKRGKEDITGENNLATGDLRVPEINSPADIYKYFPRRVGFEDELTETKSSSSEEIGSRGNTSDSDGQLSHDHTVRSPSNRTGTSVRGKTVKTNV